MIKTKKNLSYSIDLSHSCVIFTIFPVGPCIFISLITTVFSNSIYVLFAL